MKFFNITGFRQFKTQDVPVINVCRDKPWRGFITKPVTYLNYIEEILGKTEKDKQSLVHVLLMDSDTLFGITDKETIWYKYDCVRNNKDIVVSTEMSCWIGRYCTDDDIAKWYNNIDKTPGFSPFLNSGAAMGSALSFEIMLKYIIQHNKTFTVPKRNDPTLMKFDDQYAFADYSLRIAPERVALDFHQGK